MPTEDMLEDSVGGCYRKCALAYEFSTGIRLSIPSVKDSERSLESAGGGAKAIDIARDICDRGRIALLMESMKSEGDRKYIASIEGDNGYVILSKGE